jgi:hypothetical protein
MTAKHTPAPWYVKFSMRGTSGTDYEVSTKDDCLSESQALENMKLIAAAPDLLEALVWYVENDDTNDTNDTPYNEFYLNGLQRAKDAVAKATGETQ